MPKFGASNFPQPENLGEATLVPISSAFEVLKSAAMHLGDWRCDSLWLQNGSSGSNNDEGIG